MSRVAQSQRVRFQELMGNADCWASIDELVLACDDAKFWSKDFLDTVEDKAKKSEIRRLIRSIKDGESWPIWASVETITESGETVRQYKQELLFDVEDYRKVVKYHGDRSTHHRTMAVGYAKRCKNRFNRQLPLPFGEETSADPGKPR